jgi:hypothetical protein
LPFKCNLQRYNAVLLFSQLCDRVSLYGFTTFGATKAGLHTFVVHTHTSWNKAPGFTLEPEM